MMRPRNVGCPKTVPDARCLVNKTANASSHEGKGVPVPSSEPVLDEPLALEPRLFGAKLTAVEVAKQPEVHPSMVCRMASRGELSEFKVGRACRRFDRAQIEEWTRSRMHGPEG